MLFYLLVCLVAAVVLVPVTFLIEKRTSKVDVHMVLAGKLGKSNQSNTRLRLTRALVLTDSRGNNYDLRSTSDILPLFVTGDSMAHADILKGSLVILYRKIRLNQLKVNDIIGLVVKETHFPGSVGEKKLRLFYKIQDGRIYVREFDDGGNIVYCEYSHPVSSYLGRLATSFNPSDSNKIFDEYGFDEKKAA